jgi:hypothetical protein
MRTVAALVPLLLAATLAAAQRPVTNRRAGADPRAAVARAVAAMGGDSALRAVRGVSVEYYGMQFALGQEETPRSPARASAVGGRITSDYAGHRRLTEAEVRLPTGTVNRSRRVTASAIGMLESQGNLTADNPGTVTAQQTAMRARRSDCCSRRSTPRRPSPPCGRGNGAAS